MNDIRARFEEIWPVPDGVVWCTSSGGYWFVVDAYTMTSPCLDHNGKFDVFTRCQESMGPVISLADELVSSIERAEILICNIDAPTTGSGYSELMDWTEFETAKILGRAKQILGREK